jgi:GntR family transcriptional regulator
MDEIVGKSPVPRYYQLKEIMLEKIRSGEWRAGDRIPSERELSEQYNISRMTARQAVSELVSERILFRKRGEGTYVDQYHASAQLRRLAGFTDIVASQGQRPVTKVLFAQFSPADEIATKRLGLRSGQPLFHVHRLRLIDEEPLAIEYSQISFMGCEKLLEEDLEQDSLYRILEVKYGLPLVKAEQETGAGLISEDEARYLKVPVGSPALFVRSVVYTEHDVPVIYGSSVYCHTSFKTIRMPQIFPYTVNNSEQ